MVDYKPIQTNYKKKFKELVISLYKEDVEGKPITIKKINNTLEHFRQYPEKGHITGFYYNKELIGYSIITYYWSNEFGGNILFLDEIYIQHEYRNKSIGKNFIKDLAKNKINNSVAICVEVMPTNKKVYNFYNQLGFLPDKRKHLIYQFI
ncbi:MAG: GNAT family N-acetyltransferase [Bacteroidales bacterium]|nr:GNAT family N-acetyltransferase [Bacteroidales bacterium]